MDLKTTAPTALGTTTTASDDGLDLRQAISSALDATDEPEVPASERDIAIEFLWHTASGVQPVVFVVRHRLQ